MMVMVVTFRLDRVRGDVYIGSSIYHTEPSSSLKNTPPGSRLWENPYQNPL